MTRTTITLLVGATVFMGCAAGLRAPHSGEITGAAEGRASVVLIRLLATTGGEPALVLKPTLYDRFKGGWMPWVLRTAALDTCAVPEDMMPPPSPSLRAAHDGWVLLSLPPGAYWLSIVPPDALQAGCAPEGDYGYYTQGRFIPAPAFLIDVRGGEPVLYAGTLDFARDKEAEPRSPATNSPGGGAVGEPPRVRIFDESDYARLVLARELPQLAGAEVTTRFVEPYGAPLAPEAIHGLVPMGLGIFGAGGVGGPGWYQRPIALWLAPAGALVGVAASGSGEGAGAIAALGIAYIPVGLLGGSIHGTVRKLVYDPCVDELTKRLRETPPAEWLWRPIVDGFSAHLHEVPLDVVGDAATPQKSVRSVLLTSVTRVQLHQVGGDVAVSVGLRARLWDVAARRWLYDRSFSYGPAGGPAGRPYETALPLAAPPRPMGAYCPPEGWDLVQGDLREAVRLLVEQLRYDLGWESVLAGSERVQG
jgi:hypothetical protein